VFAPLANRLGIWQIKWELEDLSFRFLQGDEYRRIAKLLDEKRVEREASVEARLQMGSDLQSTASRPWSMAGPSTSTASGRRCRASTCPSRR
jgi:GTP pyrophosphokinase